MRRHALWMAALIAGCALVVGLASAGPRGSDRGPDGFLALRSFLEAMDLPVESDAPIPEPRGTLMLMRDLRDAEAAAKVLDWVAAGGRLILADPGSAIVDALDLQVEQPSQPILPGSRTIEPACASLSGSGVMQVVFSLGDPVVSVPPQGQGCLNGRDGSYLVSFSHGEGRVTVMTARSAWTNQYLQGADNALLAYRLTAGFGPVVFGPALDPAGVGPAGPWESLPAGARSGLLLLAVALGAFALAEGRRFGRPVVEEPAAAVPSSRLVDALAGLYQSAGATRYAGGLLLDGTRRRVCRRLGLPVESSQAQIKAALRRSGVAGDGRQMPDILPENDRELIELGRRLADLEKAVYRT